MNRTQPTDPPATRRARREAARRETRGRRAPAPRSPWRSPFVLLTALALGVGVLFIGALQLLPKENPTATAGADIFVPADLPPADLVSGRSLGRADAPVTMTIWSDFQCPACQLLAREVEPRLVTEYVATGKLRLEYRDMIVIGAESLAAAGASRCAEEQGRFWDYHGVLFANMLRENSGGITRERLVAMADALHLEAPAFASCLDGGHNAALVEAESATGLSRFNSTPTLDFGTTVIRGVPAWDSLSAQIDQLIAAAEAG